jgi:uncharacterized membrane protein
MEEIENGKQTAIISYLTIIGSIIAIFMNNDKPNSFASFHIRQALGIFLSWFALGYFVGGFDNWGISAGFYTFIFILWLYGFVSAVQGEQKAIPFIGEFFQKLLKNL